MGASSVLMLWGCCGSYLRLCFKGVPGAEQPAPKPPTACRPVFSERRCPCVIPAESTCAMFRNIKTLPRPFCPQNRYGRVSSCIHNNLHRQDTFAMVR